MHTFMRMLNLDPSLFSSFALFHSNYVFVSVKSPTHIFLPQLLVSPASYFPELATKNYYRFIMHNVSLILMLTSW